MRKVVNILVVMLMALSLTGCFARRNPLSLAKKISMYYTKGEYRDVVKYISPGDKERILAGISVGNFFGSLFGQKAEKKNQTEDQKIADTVVKVNTDYRRDMERRYGRLEEITVTNGSYSADRASYTAIVRIGYKKKTVEGDMKFSEQKDKTWVYDMMPSYPFGR